MYIVWVISPPCNPSPNLSLLHPSLPDRNCSALIYNFVEDKK
jgi:hypothetical protein